MAEAQGRADRVGLVWQLCCWGGLRLDLSWGGCAAAICLGCFYFPGGATIAQVPQQTVATDQKTFPERKPLLGWYDRGNDVSCAFQLEWMIQYGLQFVVFDWYWSPTTGRVMLDHALAAYFRPSRN